RELGVEEFEVEGDLIIPGGVEFDEGEEKPQTDPDLARLAQESEPDYYMRVFTEYVASRKAVGSPDDVSFENFIAKLKVNEGKLKAQYQCRAVRFRVVTKDNKVSLKPVPIFAQRRSLWTVPPLVGKPRATPCRARASRAPRLAHSGLDRASRDPHCPPLPTGPTTTSRSF